MFTPLLLPIFTVYCIPQHTRYQALISGFAPHNLYNSAELIPDKTSPYAAHLLDPWQPPAPPSPSPSPSPFPEVPVYGTPGTWVMIGVVIGALGTVGGAWVALVVRRRRAAQAGTVQGGDGAYSTMA